MENLLPITDEQLFTGKQAAEYCGINVGNFNKVVKFGRLKSFYETKQIRFYRKSDLDIFKASRKLKTKSQDGDTAIEPSAVEDSKTASKETEPITELIIDPEFRSLIPPLSEAEYAKNSIVTPNVSDEIITGDTTTLVIESHIPR